MEAYQLTAAERIEAQALLQTLLADIDAGRLSVSTRVAAWLADVAAQLTPVTEENFQQMLDAALADDLDSDLD